MTTTSEASLAIEALGLGKAFGAVKAVDGLDLSMSSGGVLAMLGPNGAGKTTTIRVFEVRVRPRRHPSGGQHGPHRDRPPPFRQLELLPS